MQLGATFVIEKGVFYSSSGCWNALIDKSLSTGGKVLLDFRQEYYGHEVELNKIREVLGIPLGSATEATSAPAPTCSEDACTFEPRKKSPPA